MTDRAVRDAYDATAGAWASGPGAFYRRLGDALVAAAPGALRGAVVLDVGAGTGAVTDAARAAGAVQVVATDIALGMLQHDALSRAPAAVADACALPFASSSFDMVVAGFVVNHLDAPDTALREMARVVRRGGVVLASAFETGPSHVTKEQVDRALASFGFENPAWHDALKTEREPRTGTADGLRRVAAAGGFARGDVDVVTGAVDSGLRTAADFVDYRFGMASHAPFVASLDAATRARAYDAALAAIGDDPPPLVPTLLVLVARRS